ncbi:MAG TPA: hypothetical protein VED63_13275 [Acidimicrobiales bacterium]|nr:hypothetical protein [Acidimicrobiales bacterium]
MAGSAVTARGDGAVVVGTVAVVAGSAVIAGGGLFVEGALEALAQPAAKAQFATRRTNKT